MGRIFITGSSDGLGLLTAQALVKRGHDVHLHARSGIRALAAHVACPEAKGVFVADLSSIEETKALAEHLNLTGPWDAIIHNAGVMEGVSHLRGREGLPVLFAVNTVAPYIVTSLVNPPPKRHVIISSGLHRGGDPSLRDLQHCTYSDSKLHEILVTFWFARHFADEGVLCNAINPGWVPTKMVNWSGPDNIDAAIDTYVLLAEGSGAAEGKTGKYWYQTRDWSSKGSGPQTSYLSVADDEVLQNRLIEALEEVSGVKPPE